MRGDVYDDTDVRHSKTAFMCYWQQRHGHTNISEDRTPLPIRARHDLPFLRTAAWYRRVGGGFTGDRYGVTAAGEALAHPGNRIAAA